MNPKGWAEYTVLVRVPLRKAFLTSSLWMGFDKKKRLVDGPTARQSRGQHGADRGWLPDEAEGVVKVNARVLGESTKDPTRLVSLQELSTWSLCLKIPLPVTTSTEDAKQDPKCCSSARRRVFPQRPAKWGRQGHYGRSSKQATAGLRERASAVGTSAWP